MEHDDHPTPILPGLFEPTADGRLHLLASRGGGVTLFPRREGTATAAPQDTEPVVLAPEGTIHSWTISRVPVPTLIAQVKFAEGPFVQGYVDGDPEHPPAIGDRVDVVPYVITLPGGDEQATTYGFRVRGDDHA